MRRPLRALCLWTIVIAAIIGLSLASVRTAPAPLTLSVIGFETNSVESSDPGSVPDLEYFCAVIRMTNSSSRTINFTAEIDTPVYTTTRLTASGWEDDSVIPACGLALRERSLAPGEATTFTAIVEPGISCRIAVPYRTSDFSARIRRLIPFWLSQRVRWLSREPTVSTPVIRFGEKRAA